MLCPGNTLDNLGAVGTDVLECGSLLPPSSRQLSHSAQSSYSPTDASPRQGGGEPPHVHVDRENLSAKFWLAPVGLARNMGFAAHELYRIESLVERHREDLLEAWNGYFGPES